MKHFFTLISVFIMALVAMPVFSVTSIWDGTADIWTEGDGTQENPYKIQSAQHLAFLAEMVNGGVSTYSGAFFQLDVDIDLNNLEWNPIGYDYASGIKFDGKNHKITNLKVTTRHTYSGLFGRSTGKISNLIISGSISNAQYSGGVAGRSSGKITNCHFSGSSHADNSTYSYDDYSGGIVGYCTASITYCSNTGSSSAYYTGGIVGYCTASIAYCSNTGSSSSSSSNETYSGGIVGYSTASILYCSNTGYSTARYSGGIAGGITVDDDICVEYCYNRGTISSSYYAGGIIPREGCVKNSYNVGLLSADKKSGVAWKCSNCYYLESCGGSTSSCGTSKTAEAMRSTSFPIVLNGSGETAFVKDVDNINDGYPILAWQIDNKPVVVVSCNEAQGTTSGSGSYVSGSVATISAAPNSGYVFSRWNDGDTSNPRTIKVTENVQYVALFEQAVIKVTVGQDCTVTEE